MDYLNILAVSIGSVIVLFLLTKLMGNRQMSQLSMFDYIIGITIGSIAAEMATALEGDFLKPLIAMAVYAPVSYTHLDVYKRQACARPFSPRKTACSESLLPPVPKSLSDFP